MDVGAGDRFFWYASTAWIMWNIATSALLAGATVVVYDGAPAYPSVDAQFALAARTGITYLGTSPGYLGACEKAGDPAGRATHDLSALRTIGVDRLAPAVVRVPLGLRRREGRRAASARSPAAPTSPPGSSAARRCCR